MLDYIDKVLLQAPPIDGRLSNVELARIHTSLVFTEVKATTALSFEQTENVNKVR